MLGTNPVRGWNTHVVEEHFVEVVFAGHFGDRYNGDAGRVHRKDEVGDPLLLRSVDISSCDENPELGMIGPR